MSEGVRLMAVVAIAIVANACERAGWRWPARRFDAWLHGIAQRGPR